MFFISDPELSFAEIAEYWAPELRWSPDMVQARLESAWWLGEFSVSSGITPLELLKRLFKYMRNCDFPALVFVTPESAPPPETFELPERHLGVDFRPRVPIPSGDPATWSGDSCFHALRTLAKTPSLKYFQDWSPGFHAMKLNRNEFFRWTTARGFPDPTFWEPRDHEPTLLEPKPASEQMIRGAVRRQYDIAETQDKKPPNVKEVAKLVQADLKASGHTASVQKIQKIADSPEFKRRRRPPGKTLSSEKRGSRN
jgi:hypothetical protein